MTTPLIFGILVLFALVFLIVGVVARVITKNTTMSSLIFMSAVLFLILGLIILGEGIPIQTGSSIVQIPI